jgi:hypothetical protein
MKEIIVVVPPDRPGTVADIAERLAARKVNIDQIDVTDDHAHGIVRLQATPYDEALRALSEAGYNAMSEEVIVIRIADEPGGLAKVAARFREPQININAMRFLQRESGSAIVVLSTNDNVQARALLSDYLV